MNDKSYFVITENNYIEDINDHIIGMTYSLDEAIVVIRKLYKTRKVEMDFDVIELKPSSSTKIYDCYIESDKNIYSLAASTLGKKFGHIYLYNKDKEINLLED